MGYGRAMAVMTLASALLSCGDDSDDAAGVGPGTVTEAWAGHCEATFTRDHTVIDGFGDPALRIRRGETYLLGRYETFGSDPRASILYLTPSGPLDFDIEVEGGPLPFESNCAIGEGEARLGIFSELVLYRDAEGRDEICRVAPAQILPAGSRSAALVSGLFDDPSVYEITLSSLADVCDGETTGFVRASRVSLSGTFYVPLPFESLLTVPGEARK